MKFLVTENQFRIVISDVEDHLLNEGVNDEMALSILKNSHIENYEEIFNFLKGKDTSKNNKSLPAIASFYLNAKTNQEYTDIIKTFRKLSAQLNSPDVILDRKTGTIKVLNEIFDVNEFDKFKNFVDHYYYKESEEDNEVTKKLLSTEQNIIFENDKYIIYEAPSPQVCIDLFGRDNQNRKYVDRSFCIGAGTFSAPGNWYSTYRDPSGTWRLTFYVIVDKQKLQQYKEFDREDDTMLVVLGVRQSTNSNEIEYLAWDRNNSGPGDRVGNFPTPKDYVEHLKEEGVNIRAFLPKPYIDLSDNQIDQLTDRWSDDNLFDSLTPKQKYKYVNDRAKNLTPHQVKFLMKYMPPALVSNFVKNFHRLGNLSKEAFNLLTNNLKKSYINSKLIQLYNNNNLFDAEDFFKLVLTDDELRNYAVSHINNSLSPESAHPNNDKEESKRILGLLDPISFFESLKNEAVVQLNSNNLKVKGLPENIGDYLVNVTELEIKNLDRLEKIPESIGKCKKLITLHIWNCPNLKVIPETIGDLTSLDELVVGGCNIENIPQSIGNLKNMISLSFHGNRISSIPESLNQCTSLQMLKLEDNLIHDIPASLFFKEGVPMETEDGEPNLDAFKFESLAFVNLEENQLTEEDSELLEKVESVGGVHVSI